MQRSYYLITAVSLALVGIFLLIADSAEKITDRRLALELILIAPLLLYWVLRRSADGSNLRPR